MEEVKEIELEKFTTKTWFKSSLLGFFIGLAIIVPGISGSTIAIIFKLYDKLLYAIGNILKKFKTCFIFLLPLVIGALVGVGLGFFTVKELLNLVPFAITALFAGLMSGSAPTVFEEVKGQKFNFKRILLFILGISIPLIISIVTTLLAPSETDTLLDVNWYQYPLCIVIGFVVAITQLVPGLSASAFLMSIGYFNKIINSVSITFLKQHPMYLLIYLCLIIGFIIGLIVVSKVITFIFNKNRVNAFFMICGFVIGSIGAILFNIDIYNVYLTWANGSSNFVLDLSLGIALFIVGVATSLGFYIYEKKKKTLQN